MQALWMPVDADTGNAMTDLLSVAYRLAAAGSDGTSFWPDAWVGAFRNATDRGASPLAGGWQWVDGTPAINMQVTATGAGIWAAGEPRAVDGSALLASVRGSSGTQSVWWLPVLRSFIPQCTMLSPPPLSKCAAYCAQ